MQSPNKKKTFLLRSDTLNRGNTNPNFLTSQPLSEGTGVSWARSDLALRLTTLPLRNSLVGTATHQMGFHISPVTPMPSTDLHSPVATAQLHPRCWAELETMPSVLTAWKWRLKHAKIEKKSTKKGFSDCFLSWRLPLGYASCLSYPWLGRFWRTAVTFRWDRKEDRESILEKARHRILLLAWQQEWSFSMGVATVLIHGTALLSQLWA